MATKSGKGFDGFARAAIISNHYIINVFFHTNYAKALKLGGVYSPLGLAGALLVQ